MLRSATKVIEGLYAEYRLGIDLIETLEHKRGSVIGSWVLTRTILKSSHNEAIKGILQKAGVTPLAIREWIIYCQFMTWLNKGSFQQAEQYIALFSFMNEVG